MKPLLSILICSLEARAEMLQRMLNQLNDQIGAGNHEDAIEVITSIDNGELAIGAKRNILMGRARGKYVCYVDDDDTLSDRYCDLLVDACSRDPDCVGLVGEISIRAARRPHTKRFEMSLRHKQYRTGKRGYERTPNHLCPIRRSIAVKFPFDDINQGEDGAYAHAIASKKVLKTEVFVDEPIYFYKPSGQGAKRRDADRSAENVSIPFVKTWNAEGKPEPMSDALKHEAVLYYRKKSGANYLVETGTYHGGTSFRMTKFFSHVHTIEASPLLHEKLKPPHNQWPPNITCHLGRSYELLGEIVPKLDGARVFWLDAHGAQWGKEAVPQPKRSPRPKQGTMPTGPGVIDVPACSLLNELEVLYPLLHPGDAVLIDDANIFGTYGWPPICDIYAHVDEAGYRIRREALIMVFEVPKERS